MAPGTSCSIHPEGVTNDPSLSETLVAHEDGKVRFDIAHAAATAWGTRLSLDCATNNASQSYLVDLNDNSTFTSESATGLQPVKTGVRPPLTGDLTAIPNSQLVQGHYPMRPDVGSSLYANWVKAVSSSADLYGGVPVAILGQHNQGSYVSGYTAPEQNWDGVVQSANGFNTSSGYPFVNHSSTLYTGYQAFTLAPNPQGCFMGSSCDDSSLWAGTGGAWVSGSPTFSPALLQNGFTFPEGFIFEFFAEFYPGGVDAYQPYNTLASGDLMFIQGFDCDANGYYTTSQPAYGCFSWQDLSQNPQWVEYSHEAYPTGTTWFPASAEYVSEWHSTALGGGDNDNVSDEAMLGQALDTNGHWHPDPGNSSGTDPYVVFFSMDANYRTCGEVAWQNGTINNAQDAMHFTTYACGPN
jgi:hypothetical protein